MCLDRLRRCRGRGPDHVADRPDFFLSSLPLAAALYGRPDRHRPRWLFDIIRLDIALIALFAVFTYLYFVVSVVVTSGPEEVYNANLTQLFNVRNLLLAAWAGQVWQTATSSPWRRVLSLYAVGLTLTLAGGLLYDAVEAVDAFGSYQAGSLWDLAWMLLFASDEEEPPLARLPVVSLLAIALLILIPAIDEVSHRLFEVSPLTQAVRTRLAHGMMIPFGALLATRW